LDVVVVDECSSFCCFGFPPFPPPPFDGPPPPKGGGGGDEVALLVVVVLAPVDVVFVLTRFGEDGVPIGGE
jgi:hypothetical protein